MAIDAARTFAHSIDAVLSPKATHSAVAAISAVAIGVDTGATAVHANGAEACSGGVIAASFIRTGSAGAAATVVAAEPSGAVGGAPTGSADTALIYGADGATGAAVVGVRAGVDACIGAKRSSTGTFSQGATAQTVRANSAGTTAAVVTAHSTDAVRCTGTTGWTRSREIPVCGAVHTESSRRGVKMVSSSTVHEVEIVAGAATPETAHRGEIGSIRLTPPFEDQRLANPSNVHHGRYRSARMIPVRSKLECLSRLWVVDTADESTR